LKLFCPFTSQGLLDKELKNLVASLAISQKETNRQIERMVNKFGTFAEGLALPSIEKIIRYACWR